MFAAHSGLRYLVLLAGVVALGYLAYGLATRRPHDRPARIVTAVFVGLLDLQLLLGILTLQVRPVYPALTGHIVMMVLAAVAAHGLSVAGKRSAEPRRRYALSLAGVAVALLLIVGGITAIGRGVFQSTVS
ncbi:MAG TPA: hypothetical protein VHG28_12410 [Longimicrobiaceae bacterium]|nr:hypothetical protein [Longimicrobiaceae bacterium]